MAEDVNKIEYFLSGIQKDLLESGRILIQKFLDDYPEKLPDAIILPDTAARPLLYLLRPVFEEITKKKRSAMPNFYFFAHYVDTALSDKIDASRLTQEDLNGINTNRKVWAERAKQIKHDLERRNISDPEIVVFDSTLSRGRTIQEIDLAFGKNLPIYAFVSTPLGEENVREKSPDKRIRIGIDEVGIDMDLRRGSGVTKNRTTASLYSYKSQNYDSEKVSRLRKELKVVGNILARELLGRQDSN